MGYVGHRNWQKNIGCVLAEGGGVHSTLSQILALCCKKVEFDQVADDAIREGGRRGGNQSIRGQSA